MQAVTMQAVVGAVPAAQYGTKGLGSWISQNVVTIIILILAVCVLWAARGGHIAKGITITAGLILGVVVLGLATGNNAQELGNFVVGLFRQG